MVKMCFSETDRKRIMGALFMCATSVELSDEVQRELMVLFDSLHGTPGACRAKMESFKEREGFMDKKYELTGEPLLYGGVKLHRIRAVRDFTLCNGATVRAGELGGWLENDGNLSHLGSAWVCGDAMVYGSAMVCGDAMVSGDARVCGSARVTSSAMVCGSARVSGSAWVYGFARVYGDAWVCGDARVSGSAMVCGDAMVSGDAVLRGGVKVKKTTDYVLAGPAGSRAAVTTFVPGDDMVFCGCFSGTLEEFAARVEETHEGQALFLSQYRSMVQFFRWMRETQNV